MKAGSRALALRQIFAIPLAIALISTIGLIVALAGDGWHDIVAWIALGSPVATLIWAYARVMARKPAPALSRSRATR